MKDYIEKLFADLQLKAEDVWALIKGTVVKYPFSQRENFIDPTVLMNQLISGELDIDRMDYLLRDSLYCGVAYGKFDVERLISCLTIHIENGNAELAIEDGGIYGIRQLYLDDGAEGVLTKLKPVKYTGEDERKIYIIGEHGEKVPLQERSKVIEKINEEIKLWRLYCHEDDVTKADEILKNELEVSEL